MRRFLDLLLTSGWRFCLDHRPNRTSTDSHIVCCISRDGFMALLLVGFCLLAFLLPCSVFRQTGVGSENRTWTQREPGFGPTRVPGHRRSGLDQDQAQTPGCGVLGEQHLAAPGTPHAKITQIQPTARTTVNHTIFQLRLSQPWTFLWKQTIRLLPISPIKCIVTSRRVKVKVCRPSRKADEDNHGLERE